MSVFIGVLLLTKKQKALPDKILAVWIAVIGIHLLGYYLKQAGYWELFPHLIGITAPVPLFHGPLLYLYCLYALRGAKRIRYIDYLHFIPGIAAYLYLTPFFFFYTDKQKILVDRGEMNDFAIFSIVLLILILLSGISYAIISYVLTIKHKHKLKQLYSYNEGISLRWLRYCIVSIGLVFLFAIMVFGLRDALKVSFSFNPEYVFYTILIIFIFYIGYFGIKQENIFTDNTRPAKNEKMPYTIDKYRNSGLTDDVSANLYKRLLKIMEDEKPYLMPKLSLSKLSEVVGLSNNQLSQIINQHAGVNFHDFVNKYRVEEFLEKAKNNKHFSLLSLALDAGFNSKSSFNTIFKKHKGVSPSQYLAKTASDETKK